MPFKIIQGDLTKLKVDAIVNAANSRLEMGSGVCGAIFHAAGPKKLQQACYEIGACPVGSAVITKGFNLPSKFIIHTVGPIWHGGMKDEDKYLKSAYKSSLELAKSRGLKSVAFPLISSGIYGYPLEDAFDIATQTIKEFVLENEMDVSLVLLGSKLANLSKQLYEDVQVYIDENSANLDQEEMDRLLGNRRNQPAQMFQLYEKTMEEDCEGLAPCDSLENLVDNLDETFSQCVLRLIDEKGKSDVRVYKKANIDRKLFSKIRSNVDYKPSKATAMALAIGLELSLDETKGLLEKAGLAISMSQKFDVIISYFIESERFDIFTINEALFHFQQPLLGN